jgi:hypothetical protein
MTRPVKELAAEQSEASINRLIELRDHAESEQVCFAAAKELLDRAHGRPAQQIGITKQESRTFIIDRFGYMRKPGWEPAALPEHEAKEPEDDDGSSS